MKQGLVPGLRSSASESLYLHDSRVEKGNWENVVELFPFDYCEAPERHRGTRASRLKVFW